MLLFFNNNIVLLLLMPISVTATTSEVFLKPKYHHLVEETKLNNFQAGNNNYTSNFRLEKGMFDDYADADDADADYRRGRNSNKHYYNKRRLFFKQLNTKQACRGRIQCAATRKQRNRSRFFDRLFTNYDKRLFPTNTSAVVVEASIFVNSLDSISEVSFDYELGIFLRLNWIDQRLAFNPSEIDGEDKCDIAAALHDHLWLPDLYITNEKKAVFHSVTTPNRLITLASDGSVFYSRRIYATVHCQMELHTFPFDSQSCELTFESFSYTEKHIVLEWTDLPLEMTPNLAVPQFSISGISFEKVLRVTSRGNVSSLIVTFNFKRDVGFYLLQIYLPTFFIVLTSFTAFWIDPLAVPARVTVAVFTTLIIANMSSSLRKQLPLVSYIKAIDVWILACMVFVFLALVEYAIVNVLLRQKAKHLVMMKILETAMAAAPNAAMSIRLQRSMSRRAALSPTSPTSPTSACMNFSENCENINTIIETASLTEEYRKKTLSHFKRKAQLFFQPIDPSLPQTAEQDITTTKSGDETRHDDTDDEEEEVDNHQKPTMAADAVDLTNENDANFLSLLQNIFRNIVRFLTSKMTAFKRHHHYFLTNLSGIQRVELVESLCRHLFPIGFLTFNVIYWVMYCVIFQSSETGGHHDAAGEHGNDDETGNGHEQSRDANFHGIDEFRKLEIMTTTTGITPIL